jgi:hypothetical protein
MTAEPIKVERVTTESKIFAQTRWDAIPTLAELQEGEGVRVINHAHMLGFLDPNLPPRKQGGEATTASSQPQVVRR